MSKGFFERIEERAQAIDSLLCVGLDPHPEDLDEQSAEAAYRFCQRIIEATHDVALVYKPNSAFFEAFGADGIDALARTIAATGDVPVILDVKRGDIASTARAYARAAFETLGADAVTLSPYMGWETVTPFLDHAGSGVFVLCRTSNPGADELQGLGIARSDERVFERVAGWTRRDDAHGRVGLVVGATAPGALVDARRHAPEAWVLAPGVGAQGGSLEETIAAGLRRDGLGLLINASRAISRAADPGDAAHDLCVAIRAAVATHRHRPPADDPPGALRDPVHVELADALLDAGCVRFGRFTLKSGLESPVYLDLRRLTSVPAALRLAAQAYSAVLHRLSFDRIAALPYAGLPIGTAVALESGWPLVYPRQTVKEHGTRASVEGGFEAGERVVLVDDLATRGTSALEALPRLADAGLEVRDVVVLIDRQSGAADALADAGLQLHAVFQLTDLLEQWRKTGRVEAVQVDEVKADYGDGGALDVVGLGHSDSGEGGSGRSGDELGCVLSRGDGVGNRKRRLGQVRRSYGAAGRG